MSGLIWRMMMQARKSASSTTPKLGDFVNFSHPVFATPQGFIIMIITEVDQPTRCEIVVRHGNTGYPTYHWRRADELTLLANAKPENRRYLRYGIRHQDQRAGETS